MKEFCKKHSYIICEFVTAFIFVSAITFTTGFNINNWQWWYIVAASLPYLLVEYYKGRHDEHKKCLDVIIKVTKERFGDEAVIFVENRR